MSSNTTSVLPKVKTEQPNRPSSPETVHGIMARVAPRLATALGQKLAAQTVPILGAASGALVNTVFLSHFQNLARGHFVIRRLERAHGPDLVRAAFEDPRGEGPIALPESTS